MVVNLGIGLYLEKTTTRTTHQQILQLCSTLWWM